MTDTVYMVLDYETFSECDIKKSGGWEYSVHPSTEILCVAYRIGTRKKLSQVKTEILTWDTLDQPPLDYPSVKLNPAKLNYFLENLLNPRIQLVAHNALFEQMITANVLKRYSSKMLGVIPVERWHCTAAMARSVGLPGNLEGAGAALGLASQKDKDGHRLMLKLCKPRTPTKNNPSTRHQDKDELQKLYAYCVKDVDTEVELFLKLPKLHPKERKFWILDQKMNLRGFAVDRKLVKGALSLIDIETKRLDQSIVELSQGQLNSARQRDATLKFLRSNGVSVPDLRAGTVKETLATKDLHPLAGKILEVREAISRSSTAKYEAFELRSRFDGRARDNTLFYGAHTGRQAGVGLQPQNLFKRVLDQKDVETGLSLIRNKDYNIVSALYDKPMDLFASALRSCIVAAKGHTLDVGDFATIEVRVLFWLAGHVKGLSDLASGKDLYLDMAADIYDEPLLEVIRGYKSGSQEYQQKRQLGKQTVLGAGFGIGVGGEKFQATAKAYGMEISLQLAQKAIYAYREKHAPIPRFWSTIEQAAKLAVQNPGKAFKHGYLIWRLEGDWLTVQLPIGRKLSYFKPQLIREPTLYGDRLVLTYLGVESVSKKFIRLKTWGGKLTENVVQAVARDLLMEALLRIETKTLSRPILAVHDEILAERSIALSKSVKDPHKLFLDTMAEVPDWCPGLPIKVEGWSERRYRK